MLYDEKQKSVCVDSGQMLMNEYDASNHELDGVMVYNCDINYKESMLLKFYELVDWESYQGQIEKMGELDYYPADSQKAKELMVEIGLP